MDVKILNMEEDRGKKRKRILHDTIYFFSPHFLSLQTQNIAQPCYYSSSYIGNYTVINIHDQLIVNSH